MRRDRFGYSALVAGALLAALIWTPGAQAGIVRVGPSLPMEMSEHFVIACPASCAVTNPSVPAGASDVSPVDGVVMRWSLDRGTLAVPGWSNPQYRLRVLTPFAGGYLAAGTGAAVSVAYAGTVETFSTRLPIKAGQLVALELVNDDARLLFGFSKSANSDFIEPSIADGQTGYPDEAWEEGFLFPFNADVLPPPQINRVTPSGASFERTTAVKIAGDNFAEVSAVSVNGQPVPYTVDSMTQLTVTVPPRGQLGSVPVTLTTVAGQAASTFDYEGCVVPKLNGKPLKGGRKALKRRLCRLGEVRKRHGATAKTGRVKRQSRRSGAVLPIGTRVDVTLGLDPVNG